MLAPERISGLAVRHRARFESGSDHFYSRKRPYDDVSIFSLVLPESRDGAITIAQAPNLALWIVIVTSVLIWAWRPPGRVGAALEIVVKGGLFVWALDEVVRGVNPIARTHGNTELQLPCSDPAG